MKRLALVLAAAVLGTGCHSSTTYTAPPPPVVGDVNLYWDFLRHAPAQTGGTIIYDAGLSGTSGACPESAVDTVTVDVDGSPVASVSCIYGGVQGATLTNLTAGTSSFRVTGWRGAYAVYDSTVNLTIPANSTASYTVDVAGVPAAIDLFAALFADGPTPTQYTTCSGAGNPTIDFQVWDSAGTLVDSGVAVNCTDPAFPSFPVFVGNLDLDNYKVEMEGYNGATRNFDSCTSASVTRMAFDHFGSQTGGSGVAISLYYPPRC